MSVLTLMDEAFADMYGKGSLAILLGDMSRKAALASYGQTNNPYICFHMDEKQKNWFKGGLMQARRFLG